MNHVALIRLMWPPQSLWPNRSAGRSWKAKQDDKAVVIKEADIEAYGQLGSLRQIEDPAITLSFHKTDAAHYDLDNAHAAMKSQLDAIFKRWGRDDRIVDDVRLVRGEKVKGGCVLIEIRERDTWQHIADAARGMVQGSIK